MNKNLLFEVSHLTFAFSRRSEPFFKDISMSLGAGEIHFLSGRNGVGKSVLFRIVQGRLLKGEVLDANVMFEGEHCVIPTESIHPTYLQYIKTVHQKFDSMLADNFSFEQNLQFACFPRYPGFGALPQHKPVPEFIEKMGIDMKKQVRLLSGGQRQILAILMMLQQSTKLLLLDEPTAALDDHNAMLVMNCLQLLTQQIGLTVLIITHDIELIKRYCNGSHYMLMMDEKSGIRTLRQALV